MERKKVDTDTIATALVNMCENTGTCDEETAKGMKSSKKKAILKSTKEGSFSKFMSEIKKRQEKKDK